MMVSTRTSIDAAFDEYENRENDDRVINFDDDKYDDVVFDKEVDI